MQKALDWIRDLYSDIYYWWRYSRPCATLWTAVRDRVEAFFLCLFLAVVGLYSPKTVRRMIINAAEDIRKVR
jgi:hypothetical protein